MRECTCIPPQTTSAPAARPHRPTCSDSRRSLLRRVCLYVCMIIISPHLLRHWLRFCVCVYTRTSSNNKRSCRSASPTHLLRQSAPLRIKNATRLPACEQVFASARAISVFPVQNQMSKVKKSECSTLTYHRKRECKTVKATSYNYVRIKKIVSWKL